MIFLGRSRRDPASFSLTVVVGFLALLSASSNAFLAPRHTSVDFRSSSSSSKSFTPSTRLGAVVFKGDVQDPSIKQELQLDTRPTIESGAQRLQLATASVPTTMGQALTTFFLSRTYHGPRTVVLVLLGLLAAWWHVSTNAVTECAVASVAVLFWSIQEHWMHQHLLHSRVDWVGKQIHEQHHDKNYFHVSIDPTPLLLGWFGTVFALLVWIMPSWPLTLAATFGYGAAGLFYEWSHFIVHTKVRFPRDSFWQKMKDHHIRHHRVDSRYWLAFSVRQVDDLFGTNPDVREVRMMRLEQTQSD